MKNFKIYLFAQICLFFLAGNIHSQTQPLDASRVGERLGELLLDQETEFDFNDLSDLEMWSIVISTDSIVEVVYRPRTFVGEVLKSDFDKTSSDFVTARRNVEQNVEQQSNVIGQGLQEFRDLIVLEDEEAPIFFLKTGELEVIQALRSHPDVESVGFLGLQGDSGNNSLRSSDFESGLFGVIGSNTNSSTNRSGGSGFGCTNLASDSPVTFEDAGGYKRPWHYDEMGIQIANECTAGDNIKIALLDTGISEDQERLSTQGFKQTFGGRNISKTSTISGGVNDVCGHGTFMAGVIAGPQYDSAIRGIAYEADLVSIRSNTQVIQLTTIEYIDIARALRKIYKGQDGTSGTKIVSMSIGQLLPSRTIYYYVNRLHWRRGVLLFGAIGTSFNLELNEIIQVFPAKYSEVVGVTGVYKGFPEVQKSCFNCHYGPAVEFVVPMQYQKDPRILTHSLMMEGSLPGEVGGSSIATATMAGVAALIWSMPENQNKTNKQIRDILKANATFQSVRDLRYGWGVVDVAQAIGCSEGDSQTHPCDGVVCPEGQVCYGGECQNEIPQGDECLDDTHCNPGEKCVNGNCVQQ